MGLSQMVDRWLAQQSLSFHHLWCRVLGTPQVMLGVRRLPFGDDAGVGEVVRMQYKCLLSELVVARDQTAGADR